MNQEEQFVLDYFQLGERIWIKKYWGNIPTNMTSVRFCDLIIKKGLEQKFINKPNWTWDPSTDLVAYIVPSEIHNKFNVICLEHLKELALELRTQIPLNEAIEYKCNELLATLSLGYSKDVTPIHKKFTYDYFKLGAIEWIKKYQGNVPELMDAVIFVHELNRYELKSDFIDEHSWRLDHSMILCYLTPTKEDLYDVINIKDRGLTVTAGKDLSLADAIHLKAELLFERLKK